MSEWQPIETAPKDGTAILLAGGQDDEAETGWGQEEENMRAPVRGWWYIWGGNDEDGEWAITMMEGCHIRYNNPTHWMPIPKGPGEKA